MKHHEETNGHDAMLITRPIGKAHKVRFPNGIVIHSHWYRHPWMSSSGKIRR